MKLPISWLKEYVKTNAAVGEICDALVNIGFEVEDIIEYGNNISGVVVGKILDIKPHEDADKLKICTVDVGKEKLTIVTGANNVFTGAVVPVATDGAILPSKTIKAAPLRGVMSYGMMCSGGELNISEAFADGASVDGIMILSGDLKIGEDIVNALDLRETVLDVSITANRPDCHSIIGLCREVAAKLNAPFALPSFDFEVKPRKEKFPSVKISARDCAAYTGGLIENVKVAPSPKWMQRRLFMCGINSINNVVDITNYVLLEIGQPLHAFDMKMIEGNMEVRNAMSGEKITALNGEEYSLGDNMMLICDDKKALAIAGVMGGKFSGITSDTQTVFLESARFARGNIRSTSLKLGLKSDSSIRFERGVDYYGVEYGRRRALALMQELGVGNVTAERPLGEIERKVITTTVDSINGLLGIKVPKKSICDILTSLGFEVESGAKLKVTVPLYREDVDNYTDLAEEVIRFYGYDKMAETFMPTASVTIGGMSEKQKKTEHIKDLLCSVGAYEIMTYSFTDKKVFDKLNLAQSDERRQAIEILNPISEELSVMKTELVSGMLSVVSTNLTRKNDNFRLFELASVYIAKKLPLTELPDEIGTLCACAVGGKEDFYSVKSMMTAVLDDFDISYELRQSTEPYLHPGMSADIICDGKVIGSFGKVHPLVTKNFGIKKDVYLGSMRCDKLTETDKQIKKYKPLPKFPVVERDLAFVVSEDAEVGKIIKDIYALDTLIGEIELFDIYRGAQIAENFKSVALKIKIIPNKTLVDAEIGAVMSKITDMLDERYGAKVRS